MNIFEGCEFCAQVERSYTIINRILYQSRDLTVWPSLGALGNGHLLVLPNKHRTGFLDFEGDQCREFLDILSSYKSAFDLDTTTFLIGEHGRQEVNDSEEEVHSDVFAPRCVQHAHIHLIAVKANFSDLLDQYVGELGQPTVQFSDEELGMIEAGNCGTYVLAGNGLGEWYLWKDVQDVKSQLVRRVAANGLGKPDLYNWREHPNHEQMHDVKQFLGGTLAKLDKNLLPNDGLPQSEFDLGPSL